MTLLQLSMSIRFLLLRPIVLTVVVDSGVRERLFCHKNYTLNVGLLTTLSQATTGVSKTCIDGRSYCVIFNISTLAY